MINNILASNTTNQDFDFDFSDCYVENWTENPPYINKGGITLTHCNKSTLNLTPPTSDSANFNAIVDYLSVTFPLTSPDTSSLMGISDYRLSEPVKQLIVPREQYEQNLITKSLAPDYLSSDWDANYPNWRENWCPVDDSASFHDDMLISFLHDVSKIIPDLDCHRTGHGKFGYKHCYSLVRDGRSCGIACVGGNKNTILFSLTGLGCSGVDMTRLYAFYKTIPFIKLTRIDCAHDDMTSASVSVSNIEAMYHAGLFHSRGAAPSFKDIKTSSGDTFYIGKKQSGLELCTYQKGKQLGLSDSLWTRLELRFYAVDRVLPLEIMLNPAHYIAGAYKPLSMLSDITERVQVIKTQAKISLDFMIHHASMSYGKLISTLSALGWSSDSIVSDLSREGMPSRLELPFAPCPF